MQSIAKMTLYIFRCNNNYVQLLVLLVIYLSVSPARSELYTTSDELSRWSSIGSKTIESLEESIRIGENKLAKLYGVKELIEKLDLQDAREPNGRGGDEFRLDRTKLAASMEHPVKGFVTLNRFLKAIQLMESSFDNETIERMLGDHYSLPSSDDLIGCGEALFRLQNFYELNIEDVIKGNIIIGLSKQDNSSEPIMGSSECFELGKIAYEAGDYSKAILWFQKSFELYDDDKLIEFNELLEYMAFTAYKNNQIRYAAQLTKLWLEKEPDNEIALGNLEYYEDELEQEYSNKMEQVKSDYDDATLSYLPNNNNNSDIIRATKTTKSYADRYTIGKEFTYNDYDFAEDDIVRQLCTRTRENNSVTTRFCTRKISFSQYLSPELKIEIMNESPKILRIYDFLSENEAKHLRHAATNKLRRATVQTKQGNFVTSDRLAKTAWLSRQSDDIVHRVEQRIVEIFGLDLQSSEQLQVVNYGVGGFYGPHWDSTRHTSSKQDRPVMSQTIMEANIDKEMSNASNPWAGNDRFATILIYLNHVEAGGSTVFPKLNLTVRPIERSAVIWYNLKWDGYTDERTLHVACPVLLGSKWIATKWPREACNTFLRPLDI